MQTFLPYDDFYKSAACLDYRRLGKQRVEAYQILNVLTGKSTGWIHHPAVKMWRGYEDSLKWYGYVICSEWRYRGYNDSLLGKFADPDTLGIDIKFPHWFGDNKFHDSHKSNLMRKDPIFYGKYGWKVSDTLPYVWPR